MSIKEALYPWFCALTGRGGEFLAFRRELHERRREAETRVLEAARQDAGLFRENVCPACGERQVPRTEFANPVGYRFAVCPADGTVFMDPIPADETLVRMYNDPAETFLWLQDGTDRDPEAKTGSVEDLDAILRLVKPLQGSKILEVGCATGAFLLKAREYFDVEGCELNASTAATARSRGLKVVTGSVDAVDGHTLFDGVVMLQVIEHLPDPGATLTHILRLLRPGGFLYFNTPAIDTASFHLLRERHVHVSSFGHVSLFGETSLRRLAARTGFVVENHEYCGGHDLALHDILTFRYAPQRFRHRMALYSTRLYYATEAIDCLARGMLSGSLRPAGNQSYQRSVWRKPNAGRAAC